MFDLHFRFLRSWFDLVCRHFELIFNLFIFFIGYRLGAPQKRVDRIRCHQLHSPDQERQKSLHRMRIHTPRGWYLFQHGRKQQPLELLPRYDRKRYSELPILRERRGHHRSHHTVIRRQQDPLLGPPSRRERHSRIPLQLQLEPRAIERRYRTLEFRNHEQPHIGTHVLCCHCLCTDRKLLVLDSQSDSPNQGYDVQEVEINR